MFKEGLRNPGVKGAMDLLNPKLVSIDHLLNFLYGNYQGIIANYLLPINNIDIKLKGAQKYIDVNSHHK